MPWPHSVLDVFHARPRPRRPQTWAALCPAHDDRRPSLSLWVGRDGRLMLGCWAGCAKPDILRAVGLTMSDLFPPDERNAYDRPCQARQPARRIVETFPFADEHGVVLYEEVRYEPKDFKQRRPDGNGGWIWNLDGVRLVPYRLPDLLARPAWPVMIVEGPRKVDAVFALGLLATCNVGGTGMGWRDAYSRVLAGRRVAILPDNDDAGMKHADAVVGSLVRHGAASIRVVMLPGLPEKGDVVDWLRNGGTKNDLLALVKKAKEYVA